MTVMDGMTADTDQVEAPRPTSIMLGGEELPLTYYNGVFDTDVDAHLKDLAQLDRILEAEGFDVFRKAGINNLKFSGENFRWMSTHPFDLEYRYNERKKEAARERVLKGYRERRAACQKLHDTLDLRVRDDTEIHSLFVKVKYQIEQQGPLYAWRAFDPSKLASSLIHLERLLERCTKEWDIDDLATELVSEKVPHPSRETNNKVIDELGALEIRSEGMIEPPTEDALKRFYVSRLRGKEGRTTITLSDAYRVDLTLKMEEYAPADILKELELLPEFLEVEGKLFAVEYQYKLDEHGEWVPASVIEVPISAYRRLAPAYGKSSGIPAMAEGVRMYLKVTKQGKELEKGFDTVELAKKVEQREKGLKRVADVATVEGPTSSPDWRQGRFKRNSRR